MTPNPSGMQEFEYDWLQLAAHETLLLAQSQAMHMHAEQVYPEHFLLAVSMHGDNRAAYLLSNLGITREKLLSLEIDTSRLGNPPSTRPSFDLTGNVLPLSADLQRCVYQAIAVAKHLMHTPSVAPEHLVLSILSHQRVQSFLSPLALTVDTILEYLKKFEEIRGTGLLLATFFKQVMSASAHEKLTIPSKRGMDLTRGLLRDFFLQAKYKSPRLFLIDDLDAIGRSSGREQLLDQLMAEIDLLGDGKRSVVVATAGQPRNLSYVLRRTGFFKYAVFMHHDMPEISDPIKPSMKRANFCPSCKHSIQPQWHHCPYCGVSLARVCPHCGAPYPEIEGTQFCFECGGKLEA